MLLNKQVLHRIQLLSRHIEHQNDTEIEEPIQKIDLDYFGIHSNSRDILKSLSDSFS